MFGSKLVARHGLIGAPINRLLAFARAGNVLGVGAWWRSTGREEPDDPYSRLRNRGAFRPEAVCPAGAQVHVLAAGTIGGDVLGDSGSAVEYGNIYIRTASKRTP